MTNHVITTLINNIPHAIHANGQALRFEPVSIAKSSGLSRAYQGDVTSCLRILEWIHANDHELARHSWDISPAAKFI